MALRVWLTSHVIDTPDTGDDVLLEKKISFVTKRHTRCRPWVQFSIRYACRKFCECLLVGILTQKWSIK